MKYEFPAGQRLQGCKIMLMARNALAVGNTPFVAPCAQQTGENFNYTAIIRRASDQAIENLLDWPAGSLAGWLRLRRKGNTFTSFWKAQAEDEWTVIGTAADMADGVFGKEIFIGPAITTWTDQPVGSATVTEFQIRSVKSATILLLQ